MGLSRQQVPKAPEPADVRALLVSDLLVLQSRQAAERGDRQRARRCLGAAMKAQEGASAETWREFFELRARARAEAHRPARPRDAEGRYVARPNGNGRPHRNGNGRARAHHDGARSSARSGDSCGDDPEPEHGRLCRCDHPLILADTWAGPRWSRCLWCGHDARELVL